MQLREFESQLKTLIGQPTDLRPFVCDGSPLQCKVFLVGINPATMMVADFWDFWSDDYGFDKRAWLERYLEERAAKPLKPGRTRRQKVSATRRNIEHFIEGAAGVQVLETNIFPKPSEDLKSLDIKFRETAPFRFLLTAVAPKVIVVHGKLAVEALKYFDHSATVIEAERHFSRGVSAEAARRYGAQAASACDGPD